MHESQLVHAPDLGAAGPMRVSAWLVNVGETVREGDRLVELLVPGLTYDVPAPVDGWLTNIRAPMNSAIGPGEVLGTIRPREEDYLINEPQL